MWCRSRPLIGRDRTARLLASAIYQVNSKMRSLAYESSCNQSLAVSICCILGAGYSHVAGAPLTRDLFATRDVAVSSEAARRRFQTVWDHYDTWLAENPSRNPEEYLADLL